VLIEVEGLPVELLGSRAVWMPRSASLLLADLHLGKAQSFRSRAVPVPAGTTASALARLDALIASRPARELIVLGDFLHDRRAFDSSALPSFVAWRARYPSLTIHLVRGNHDRAAGDPPPECGIEVEPESLERGGLMLRHEPEPAAEGFAIVGHLHPVVRLIGAVDRLRLPCFWLRARALVLPAFGEFTGGWPVQAAPTDRLFVADGQRVLEVPAKARLNNRSRVTPPRPARYSAPSGGDTHPLAGVELGAPGGSRRGANS
jgi:DNA ligase-associated metallophosphoesterase